MAAQPETIAGAIGRLADAVTDIEVTLPEGELLRGVRALESIADSFSMLARRL